MYNIKKDIGERLSRNGDKIKRFKLLYKADAKNDNDKVNVDEFHSACDNKGPTVTVLYGEHNTIYGGYTSHNWSSPRSKETFKDDKAFLFTKNDNAGERCIFLPIKKNKANIAITCYIKYGPTFGYKKRGGYDLQAFNRGKHPESVHKDRTFHLNGSLNIKNAYAVERGDAEQADVKSRDINSGQMIVKSLEVYQVTDDEIEDNWLSKLEGEDFDKTKQKFVEMRPQPELNIDRYNILLLGPIGAGKSSFINTVSTVFTQQVVQITPTRDGKSSVTPAIKPYHIKTGKGDKTTIYIYDVPGFEDKKGYGDELERLLDGVLPKDYQSVDKNQDEQQVEINPSMNDKIHFVCMVEGYPYCEGYSTDILEHIENIKSRISKKGLPLAVVATKFDLLCPNIAKDVKHLFKSPKAKEAVETISSFYGVQTHHVFPVVNYTKNEPNEIKDKLALSAINEICKSIDGFLMHYNDQENTPDRWTDREKSLPCMKNEDDKRKELRSVTDKLMALENQTLRVLLVGQTGSGKSSFIDSLASVLRNEIVTKAVRINGACANEDHATPNTEKYQLYCMKYMNDDAEPRYSTVFLGDTPGFQEDKGITDDDVKLIIKGIVPDKFEITRGTQESQREPSRGDKIHCLCLVFDCENIRNGLSEKMKMKMSKLIGIANTQESKCPLMVILTKCDKVSSLMNARKHRVFQDVRVSECKDFIMKTFGFKQKDVFPVVNYDDDNVLDGNKDSLLLAAFLNMLQIGKNRLQDIEEEEAGQRKKGFYW